MEVPASIKHLPNINLANDEYEQGFTENLLITKELGECFLCQVCFGIPRRPIVLKKCGHGFCEVCMTKHVIQSANHSNIDRFSTAKCPVCSTAFMKFEPVPYEKFSIPSKKAFNLIQLKCPYGCPFVGSPHDMDDHQSYECERRTVRCPNRDCNEKMNFKKLFEEHVMSCDKLRIYCDSCFLPMAKADVENHDCKERLAMALGGMITPLVLVLN